MPIEKRLPLHAQYPDAEHPVVRTHPETGEKVLFVNAYTTHFFHNPDNVRYGQDYAPGASQLLQYLISQAAIPEYQVRFRWKPNSVAMRFTKPKPGCVLFVTGFELSRGN